MRFSQWLSLIVLVVCLYVLWQIRNVVLLALTAVVFVVVLNRAVNLIQKRIPDRKVAVLALTSSLLLVIGVFGVIIFPPFYNQLQELFSLTPEFVNQVQGWIDQFAQTVPVFSSQDFQGLDSIFRQIQSINLEMVFGRFYQWFSNTLTFTLQFLLVTAIIIMMLLNPKAYQQLLLKTFPSSQRQRVSCVLNECEDVIAGWFIGILFNMTVIAIMSMTGLWILGIPLAFANGLVAGLLAFIPNIGPVISVIPPTAIALLEAPWKAIGVVVLYVVIQQIESNILTPLVMKRQVSLLPAVTLLAQVTFAVFFGFLGLLLALPLTLIIQQWLNEFWVKGFLDQR